MNQLSPVARPGLLQRSGTAISRLPITQHVGHVRRAIVRPFLFFITLVAVAAGIYFFGLASPIYTSEAQIAVRGRQAMTASPLLAALNGATSGVQESTALTAYIESGGMLKQLDDVLHLRKQYSEFRPDFYYHLPAHSSGHEFFTFYKGMVDVTMDSTSSIIDLKVRAFNPVSARETAIAIMKNSQDFVERLSDQMRAESTRAAQQDLDAAQRDALTAHQQLAAFQASSNRLDPAAYGTAATAATFQLQSTIAQLRSQLASIQTYSTAQSPQVKQVQAQIANLNAQQRELQQKITGDNSKSTVVNQLGTFQRLSVEQAYADQRVVAAQAALDQARSVAQQRQLFVVPITEPTLPDEPTPRRWWGFATAIVIALTLYIVFRLVIASIRDHQM